MDLVERAGKALYELWVEEDFDHEYCSWELLPSKAIWLDRARAVLMAIREPTPEMVEAGGNSVEIDMIALGGSAEAVWQAMLDTALTAPASSPTANTHQQSHS